MQSHTRNKAPVPAYLPDGVALQYSELMQQCVRPLSDGSNLSFKSKTINDRKYWYLYVSLGSRRSEHYIGADSEETRSRIEQEKSAWETTADDRNLRSRLVAMLLAGCLLYTSPSPRDLSTSRMPSSA